MALARNFVDYNTPVNGSVARELSTLAQPTEQPRPQPKVAPKKAKGAGQLVAFASFAWALVMLFSFALVRQSVLIQKATHDITRAKEDLSKVELRIREDELKAYQAVSTAEIEKWATAHDMKRPTTVKAVIADPSAVAVRQAPEPATAPTAVETAGFWSSLKTYLAKLSGGGQVTSRAR